MNIKAIEKALRVTTAEAFESNLNLTLDGKFKGFDFSKHTDNVEKIQCQKCHPPLSKPRGELKLCSDCTAQATKLGEQIFQHISRPRRVVKLQRCFACDGCFSPLKFSTYFGICKKCLGNRDEPVPVRRKFVAHALNNISKVLRGALAL